MKIPKSAIIFALISMAICGFAYRTAANRLQQTVQIPIVLPVPLGNFPLAVGDWEGKNAPLAENVAKATGNDDFCNRLYTNKNTSNWANVYIAYSARPRTMLGHKPTVCYPAAGWVHDSTDNSNFVTKSGVSFPCLVHRFHLPSQLDELVVLNFYIINGKPSTDESFFSGIEWRTPNINGDIARYVAQVQISSSLENTVRMAAEDMADSIVKFFPQK